MHILNYIVFNKCKFILKNATKCVSIFLTVSLMIFSTQFYSVTKVLAKATIIAAYAGVGKTYLGNKYKNVLDLESLNFKWIYSEDVQYLSDEQKKGLNDKRELNENWPQNYVEGILKNYSNFDYILVSINSKFLDILDERNIDYILVYPDLKSKEIYMRRFICRGNGEKRLSAIQNTFENTIKSLEQRNVKKIVLSGEETLEDWFIKNNYKLIEKC